MTPSVRDAAVVIVGGGPSGLTTALSLAHRAPELSDRILVLERGRYPRDKTCAGAVGERGLRILRALDAEPEVPGVPLRGIAFTCADGRSSGRLGSSMGRVVRRIEFDHALARIAMSRGIQVWDGMPVDGVSHGDGHAVVHTAAGPLHARVVVGADGVGSVVRRAMGLSRGLLRAQVIEVDTEPAPGDPPRDMLHFDATDHGFTGYAWDFPTLLAEEALVCRGVYHLRLGGPPVDLEHLLSEHLARRGVVGARLRRKRYAERGYVRRERVADGALMLVGEAAGVDAVSGEGIAQAIELGERAGAFLVEVLLRGGPVSDWNAAVRRSRVSLDLAVRTRLVAPFYGDERRGMERFMLRRPEVIRLGCQHFAQVPYDGLDLAKVLLAGGLRFGRAFLHPAYRKPRWEGAGRAQSTVSCLETGSRGSGCVQLRADDAHPRVGPAAG